MKTSAISFRWYQQEAIDAIDAKLETSLSTLLVAAVGAGKTIMQAGFIQRIIGKFPDARFVCVVHTRELVAQNYMALINAWPEAPAGINSAALGRRDTRSQILFCSIQSVYKLAQRIGWVDCLIVDECHLISRTGTTMYRQLIDELRAINPDMRLLGMSGTPFRMDSGSLTEGEDALFEDVAYEIGIGTLIAQGFLTRPISKGTLTTFDVTGVHTRGGEYIAGELEAAVDKDDITAAAVDEIIRYGHDRKSWIVFCVSVEHADHMCEEFRRRGISCAMIEGNMDASERRRTIEAYKRGEIQCLTNVNVLSIGFDHPAIDLIALCRPTKSAALYIQQCGRGLRLAPGKENCLILDFANVVRTLGPIDAVQIKPPSSGTGEAPIRLCPECNAINHASVHVCVECGFKFPVDETPKHSAHADVAPILSTDEPAWEPVTGVEYRQHDKVGAPPSVKITYSTERGEYPVWVCPQHWQSDTGRRAKEKADRFWFDAGGDRPFPRTVDEFLDRAGELKVVTHITVKKDGRYWNVTGVKRNDDRDAAYVRPPKRGNGNIANAMTRRWDFDETDIPF